MPNDYPPKPVFSKPVPTDYLQEVLLLKYCSKLKNEQSKTLRIRTVLDALRFQNGEHKLCSHTIQLILTHFGTTLDEFCNSMNEEEVVLRYETFLLLFSEEGAGLNYRQIATIFNVPKSTVSRGINRRHHLDDLKIRRKKDWKLWLSKRHLKIVNDLKTFKKQTKYPV